jgi:two-component system nitrogen regulation sensor histidine kinase NtrY
MAGVLGLLSVGVALARRRPMHVVVALAALVAAASVSETSLRTRAIETRWPELRDRLIDEGELAASLNAATEMARSLADSAISAANSSPEMAFSVLERALRSSGPERGVVLLDTSGTALAWAGRHRLAPAPWGNELSARITPFYVVLEARRQEGPYLGIGQVVLAADSAVPDREETLAEQFRRSSGASLEFHAPLGASQQRYVFDYTLESGSTRDTLFSVITVPPDQGTFKLQIQGQGARRATWLVFSTLALLVIGGPAFARWLGLVVGATLLLFTPAGSWLPVSQLFSSATYYLDSLGPVTASGGSLLTGSAILAVAVLAVARRGVRRHPVGLVIAGLVVLVFPWVMEYLASGITPPASEIGLAMWMGWETTLAVAGAVLLLVAAILVRGKGMLAAPPLTAWIAVAWAAGCAVLGLVTWNPPSGWPVWYAVIWLPAVLMAVMPAPKVRMVAVVATVSGAAAASLTWGEVIQGRLVLAERDAMRASGGDPYVITRLDRFGETLELAEAPRTATGLYQVWRSSGLAVEDYPAVLSSWGPDPGAELGLRELARLNLAELNLSPALLRAIAASARDSSLRQLDHVVQPPSLYVLAVPLPDSSVVTIGVGPQSRLIEPVRLARFLRGERHFGAPYSMVLSEASGDESDYTHGDRPTWSREGWTVRGVMIPVFRDYEGDPISLPGGPRQLHIQIPLSSILPTLVRGVLLMFWNIVLLGLLWFAGEALSGRLSLPPLFKELAQLRSYRTRLTIALAAFFVVPTLAYAVWSFARIRADAARRGDLLIEETLSDAMPVARGLDRLTEQELENALAGLAGGLNADLLWHEGGLLRAASPEVLLELGLVDRYMPPDVYRRLAFGDELELTADVRVGGQPTRAGYRSLRGFGTSSAALAALRLVDLLDVLSDQEDLLYLLVLATLLGLTAAVILAGVAARSLAYPVRALRGAAVAVGRGDPVPPFSPGVPTEFVPVVDAFERMARDVEASQSALDTARRRAAAVLRNVATGVVAVDRDLRVTMANPMAESLLGAPLPAGAHVYAPGGGEWGPVWRWLREFMNQAGESEAREFVIGAKQVRAHATAIRGQPGGCVLALDDATELTRATRILAWGELARQVAHEIKNPLTPIRLGVQHLLRAHRDGRGDFETTLDRTARQILAEIERLDAIARAFARFGAPPAEAEPLTNADLVAISRDTAELYALTDGTSVAVDDSGAVVARVRKDEVKEVLVNLIENARDAGATEVRITVGRDETGAASVVVRDNGAGIARDVIHLVFEPQFSTTTSGTGLGLAICRRLVESWGGTIIVESELGRGTAVRIVLPHHAG